MATEQLQGKTPLDSALILQYVNFADQELLPAVATWVFPTLGLMPFNKQVWRLFVVLNKISKIHIVTSDLNLMSILIFKNCIIPF